MFLQRGGCNASHSTSRQGLDQARHQVCRSRLRNRRRTDRLLHLDHAGSSRLLRCDLMAIKTRKQRMTDVERRTMTPHGAIDFEVIDYKEMKPGISVLTYKYTSTS